MQVKPVLLVWEVIPDATKFYYFQDLTQEEFNHLLGANGTFINSNGNEHTEWLNMFLCNKVGEEKQTPVAVCGDIGSNTCTPHKPVLSIQNSCYVVISGFVL